MPLNKDDRARVIAPIIEGVIERVRYNEDTGEKSLLLAWTGADGEAHSRWFAESELEGVAAPAPNAAPAA